MEFYTQLFSHEIHNWISSSQLLVARGNKGLRCFIHKALGSPEFLYSPRPGENGLGFSESSVKKLGSSHLRSSIRVARRQGHFGGRGYLFTNVTLMVLEFTRAPSVESWLQAASASEAVRNLSRLVQQTICVKTQKWDDFTDF